MNLVKNGLVLSFARLTNYAMMLATPLFMVRMLDIETYGQYREFLLYALILASVLGLSIKDNLIYTIPRHPDRGAAATTQTVGMLLTTTTLGLALFAIGSPWLMSKASWDFLWPLVLYVFFFLNFDVLEGYWIARQQPRFVLIYTSTRTLIRILVVLGATYYLRDLPRILATIIAFEVVKSGVCLYLLIRIGALRLVIDRALLSEQLRFILPLSGAGLLYFVNEKAGHFFISTTMGASALAIYTIGTYQLPITTIVRSAVADTLFPEMVKHAATGSGEGMRLWKQATVFYCLLVFPIFAVLFTFAEQFVTTLFTRDYVEAVGVFQIALLLMLRQCFEMGTPLRAQNSNKPLLIANMVAIAIHLPLLALLAPAIGIRGAAISWLTADMVITLYLARTIMNRYNLRLAEFSYWRPIAKLAFAAVVTSPLLIAAGQWSDGRLWPELLAAPFYMMLYVGVLKLMRLAELDAVFRIALGLFGRRSA